jgi:uncharacterized membrane protein YcaP (DUF421 family)
LIGAGVLIAANDLISRFARRNEAVDRTLEGTQTRLVEDGKFLDLELRRLGIRHADLESTLRQSGAEDVAQVKQADLYPSGAIVVDLRQGAQGASHEDIDRLEQKLDRLTASVERLASG